MSSETFHLIWSTPRFEKFDKTRPISVAVAEECVNVLLRRDGENCCVSFFPRSLGDQSQDGNMNVKMPFGCFIQVPMRRKMFKEGRGRPKRTEKNERRNLTGTLVAVNKYENC